MAICNSCQEYDDGKFIILAERPKRNINYCLQNLKSTKTLWGQRCDVASKTAAYGASIP